MGSNCTGGSCPGGVMGNCPGGKRPVSNCPKGIFTRGQ